MITKCVFGVFLASLMACSEATPSTPPLETYGELCSRTALTWCRKESDCTNQMYLTIGECYVANMKTCCELDGFCVGEVSVVLTTGWDECLPAIEDAECWDWYYHTIPGCRFGYQP